MRTSLLLLLALGLIASIAPIAPGLAHAGDPAGSPAEALWRTSRNFDAPAGGDTREDRGLHVLGLQEGAPPGRLAMIRSAAPEDKDALIAIADASGLFRPHELEEVSGILAAYFAGELGPDHHWITDDDGGPAAVAYYAPEPFTDGVWNLYMLAVHPDRQGGGHGGALVRYVEESLRASGARVLLIETSGLPRFERTRAFYRKCGYDEEARIRDYYAAGDDKIVFWKSLA